MSSLFLRRGEAVQTAIIAMVVAVAPLCLTACKGTKAAVVQAPTPDPGPTPAPPAPPPPPVELASIASNFDIESELEWTEGTGTIPPSSPDPVGAFRFICAASHESYDDPVVYPGQPGRSHLHQYFGNTLADAHSTYESLRKTGASTCNSPLNRSAYWMPAMMNGKGKVVRPDYVTIYYKRYPKTSPLCQREGKECVALPRGLRFVFGYDMLNVNGAPTGNMWFNCEGPSSTPGHYPDIVAAARNCGTGERLGAVIIAPGCWDGKNLDSPDHRSHVAYKQNSPTLGYAVCPPTHPYVIPEFQLGAWYTTDEDLDRSGVWQPGVQTWHLSSDIMPGMIHRPGSTFHSDWFGAWDDTVMKMWTDNCIDLKLTCAGGDLGNGKSMKMFAGFSFVANPRLVDPPPAP